MFLIKLQAKNLKFINDKQKRLKNRLSHSEWYNNPQKDRKCLKRAKKSLKFNFKTKLTTTMDEKENKKPRVPIYVHEIEYLNKYDKVRFALKMYAESVNIRAGYVYIRPRMVDVMAFYILYGYSSKTKNKILATTDFSRENLNQINSELTKKGYLLMDQRNFRIKHLCPAMEQIRDFFLAEDENPSAKSLFAFSFKRKEF